MCRPSNDLRLVGVDLVEDESLRYRFQDLGREPQTVRPQNTEIMHVFEVQHLIRKLLYIVRHFVAYHLTFSYLLSFFSFQSRLFVLTSRRFHPRSYLSGKFGGIRSRATIHIPTSQRYDD